MTQNNRKTVIAVLRAIVGELESIPDQVSLEALNITFDGKKVDYSKTVVLPKPLEYITIKVPDMGWGYLPKEGEK